ncbi:MAG: ABC transporter permease, partial [Tumebacillaceae bacterium]
MKQAWAICLFEIRRVFKQKKSWVLMFAMPIVFSLIFGGLSGDSGVSKTKLALVDEDATVVSQSLVKKLLANETLEISTTSGDAAQTLLHDKKVAGILIVPQGLEQSLAAGVKQEIKFQHGPDLSVAATISQTLNDLLAQTAVNVRAAGLWSQGTGNADWHGYYAKLADSTTAPAVAVDAQQVTKDPATEQLNGSSRSSIGFSIMFLMMSMMSVTGTILEARKNGVWYRLMSTPMTRLKVLGGYMLSFFFTGWIQFGLLM